MFAGGRDDRDGQSNPIALLAMMIFAPMAAMLIQMAISRSREFAADAGAAAITGNPRALADALRKIDAIAHRVPLDANPATAHMFIVKPFSGGGLMSLFSTHPPTEARVQALLQAAGKQAHTSLGWRAIPTRDSAAAAAGNSRYTVSTFALLPCFQLSVRPRRQRSWRLGLPLAASHGHRSPDQRRAPEAWRRTWRISTFRKTSWLSQRSASSIAPWTRRAAASTRS